MNHPSLLSSSVFPRRLPFHGLSGRLLVLALLSTLACSQAGEAPSGAPAIAQGSPAAPAAPAATPHAAAIDEDDAVPVEKFAGGAKAFGEVRDVLLKSYY